jgi:hypothetical protein
MKTKFYKHPQFGIFLGLGLEDGIFQKGEPYLMEKSEFGWRGTSLKRDHKENWDQFSVFDKFSDEGGWVECGPQGEDLN